MEIRETSLSFPVARGSGPMRASRAIVFPREVVRAVAGLRGYQVGFSGEDHHVGLLEVALESVIEQNVVTVNGRLACRDWSGNWDDDYGGSIQVTVLAELVSASEPPPRGDLLVTDLEINQAVQYFRAADHLAPDQVRPDNSIPLIAGKATGIRAYVDYDSGSGLPPIANLSGELTVRSGGATQIFTPLAPIAPRRATEIERGLADHTLNFMIPGAWCDGIIEIALRVFDAGAPGQKSAAMRRTLRFVRVNPLRVYAVGVNYTGAGLNLPAPVETDFASTLDYARRVWPTGEILLSGYTTIPFSASLAGTASQGCGSGFNSLLDQLRDIKGDTDDLVYGLLPGGTPLTGVGGCGGGGAGTGMIGDGVTLAHEAGHAVGRKHAPCDDSARCDSPLNTDDDYPSYGSYVSDSVGEFGFDPQSNSVFDPATTRDFMGYSPMQWISPYTYAALMAKGDPSPSTGGAGFRLTIASAAAAPAQGPRSGRAEWIKRREPVLFLRVKVDGDQVELFPSFTWEAYRRPLRAFSGYEVHVVGKEGEVIACTQLEKSSGSCSVECGPMELIAEVPLAPTPCKLLVRREGRDLASYEFEEPVRLDCDWARSAQGDITLSWEGRGSGAPIWYLVQWEDRDGTWRGLAPRTSATKMTVPKRILWASKGRVRLRVLAVEWLTTAACGFDLDGEKTQPPLSMTPFETEDTVGVIALDPLGRQAPSGDLAWFDDRGGEVARGDRVPRGLAEAGLLRAVALGTGITKAESFTRLPAAGDEKRPDDKPDCGDPPPPADYRKGGKRGNKA